MTKRTKKPKQTKYTRQSTIIRLAKICPVWSKILAKQKWNAVMRQGLHCIWNEKGELISSSDKYAIRSPNRYMWFTGHSGLVGEAHKGNEEVADEECKDCYKFEAGLLTNIHEQLDTESDWIKYLNEFMDHFDAKHHTRGGTAI